MKKIVTILGLFGLIIVQAQVGIGTDSPNTKAALDVTATDKGVLIPRMTTIQRTAMFPTADATAAGMQVYDTTTKSLWFYDGTEWKASDNTNDAWKNNTTTNVVELAAKSDGTTRAAGTEVVISDIGNLGLATTNPLHQLDVAKNISSRGLYVGTDDFNDRATITTDNIYVREPIRTTNEGNFWGTRVDMKGAIANYKSEFKPFLYATDENGNGIVDTEKFYVTKEGGAFFRGKIGIGVAPANPYLVGTKQPAVRIEGFDEYDTRINLSRHSSAPANGNVAINLFTTGSTYDDPNSKAWHFYSNADTRSADKAGYIGFHRYGKILPSGYRASAIVMRISPRGDLQLSRVFAPAPPKAKLDVDGYIKLGSADPTGDASPTPGTLRYNATTNKFQGYVGGSTNAWVDLH